MAEETKEIQPESTNYLEDALKANTNLKEQLQATREEMARMAEDNKAIMKQLLEGGEFQTPKQEDTRSIPDIIKAMNSDNISDVEYATLALAYRDKCISEGYGDPFVGKGHKYTADEREAEKAQNFADSIKHCIEYSEGNNEVFINEVNRITVDVTGGIFNKNRR